MKIYQNKWKHKHRQCFGPSASWSHWIHRPTIQLRKNYANITVEYCKKSTCNSMWDWTFQYSVRGQWSSTTKNAYKEDKRIKKKRALVKVVNGWYRWSSAWMTKVCPCLKTEDSVVLWYLQFSSVSRKLPRKFMYLLMFLFDHLGRIFSPL